MLNRYAGRSFNDLSSYPFLPWVGPVFRDGRPDRENLRDLSIPSAALSENKQSVALEHYSEDMVDENTTSIYGSKPYHLKFGYSNRAQCLSYMMRVEPFTSGYINFQGKFDDPNRLFLSIDTLFDMVYSKTQCNYELIPEMFYFTPMFSNFEKYFIGRDKDNNFRLINEIKLPKWAHGNPHIYCMKNRLFINDMKYEEKNMD